jgi:hypothetical protein
MDKYDLKYEFILFITKLEGIIKHIIYNKIYNKYRYNELYV